MAAITTPTLRDTPSTLPQMIDASARHPGPALRFRRAGRWLRMGYPDVHRQAQEIARGLIALDIRPGERIAILGGTNADWTLADLGVLSAGGVVVPIYQTNSPGECQYVLEHSGARAILLEDGPQLEKILAVREDCPDLEHIVVLRPGADVPDGVLTLRTLVAHGSDVTPEQLAAAGAAAEPDDPATIVYTSGTTGPPKGCVITHANFLATTAMYEDQMQLADEDPVVFMFLPLAHVLARVVQMVSLKVGGEIVYWSGDPARLLEDIKDARPTHFPSVPRVFEKIHTAALSGLEEADPVKRALFNWAIATGGRVRRAERENRTPGVLDRAQYALAERLVFTKIHALFGGRLRRALTGAAPIGREVLDFFDACGITILEGYGLTETCAAATLNTPDAHRLGSVGMPLSDVEVRIAADGEILIRGPQVFHGYYHNEEATQKTLDADGWLYTGDLGEIDDDGYLMITGRKKDLIITSSGKNISPANIETQLQETRWISHAVVYGDNKPYLVALVTIDPDEAAAMAEHAGLDTTDVAALGEDPTVRALLHEAIEEVNTRFAKIEQIKRFDVLDHDLTQAAGELTPTLKLRRAPVYERYGDRFEALYKN